MRYNLKTGDSRENRRLAESVYTALKEYGDTGQIPFNPSLAEELDSLSPSEREAYFSDAASMLRRLEGFRPHANQLELLAAKERAKEFADYDPESIPGVIQVLPGKLYVKSPESLPVLLEHLAKVGYEVKDISSEKNGSSEKPSREVQEKDGWLLWYGSLTDRILETKAECGSCKSLISFRGVETHEHECEDCGDYTFVAYSNGGKIRFYIVDDNDREFRDFTLVIHSFDKDKKQMNFYANLSDCKEENKRIRRSFMSRSMESSYSVLPEAVKRFPETFTIGEIDGVKVVSVSHNHESPYIQEHSINPCETIGEKRNYRQFKLFKGKKFREFLDQLPIPDGVQIYEAWHWAPLQPGPRVYEEIMSAASQVSRKDFYHQDGRPAFTQRQIDWMLKFIEHFTTVDVNVAGQYLHPKLSGPNLIDILAGLTGHRSTIDTMPNIGNAMDFFGKVIEGEPVTVHERDEAVKGYGLDDPHNALEEVLGRDFVQRTLGMPRTPKFPEKKGKRRF
jgi:hypothetical protein